MSSPGEPDYTNIRNCIYTIAARAELGRQCNLKEGIAPDGP